MISLSEKQAREIMEEPDLGPHTLRYTIEASLASRVDPGLTMFLIRIVKWFGSFGPRESFEPKEKTTR